MIPARPMSPSKTNMTIVVPGRMAEILNQSANGSIVAGHADRDGRTRGKCEVVAGPASAHGQGDQPG